MLKEHNQHLFLTTPIPSAGPNGKMFSCLRNQIEKTAILERNEEVNF